jgi:hypothetical protein
MWTEQGATISITALTGRPGRPHAARRSASVGRQDGPERDDFR